MSDRPGREIPKDYREVVTYQIDHHGWRYDASGKGYPVLYPSDKSQPPLRLARTPSDRRGFKNFLSAVRQRGGTWPPEGRQR